MRQQPRHSTYSYVYTRLTSEERQVFDQLRTQYGNCTASNLVRMALDDFAESHGMIDVFTITSQGRPRKTSGDGATGQRQRVI